MQLFEIKNDIAKILYTPSENHILLADFLLIEDVNQSLIAQVTDIESTNDAETNIATVKFSLSISKTANLSTYNGYTPAKTAQIVYIEPSEIAQLIQSSNANLYWGDLASHPDTKINLGLSLLKERPYIQCDKTENTKIITTNIIYGLLENKKRTIVIDFDKKYKDINNANLITISKEYKLPLNFEAFNFIAEHDLEDCSTENKAIIQGILLELQSYVQTLEDGFIPFDIFKSVIDEQCNQNPIPELLIFKNKLVKYQQQGLFAQSSDQFNFLDKILSKSSITVVEAGDVDKKWHKFILNTIAEQLDKKCYLITNFDDTNSDEQTIETLYQKENLRIIPVSEYKYSNSYKMKSICKNLILFAPIEKTNDFEIYNSFLNKLNQKEFIIWSENTFYMPLILKLKAMDSVIQNNKVISEEIKNEVDKMLTAEAIEPQVIPENISIEPQETHTEPIIVENQIQDEITDEDLDFLDELDNIDELEEIPEIGEIAELPASNQQEEFIEEPTVIEEVESPVDSEPQEQIILDEEDNSEDIINQDDDELPVALDSEKDIVEQKELLSTNDVEPIAEQEPQIPSAEIVADEDIEFEEFEEDTLVVSEQPESPVPTQPVEQQIQTQQIEEPAKPAPTPIEEHVKPIVPPTQKVPEPIELPKRAAVPIYEAKIESKNPEPTFKEGNFVFHAKYGRGIVEKIITYGNKTLCSIQFENVGRRLLDPNLADIKLA